MTCENMKDILAPALARDYRVALTGQSCVNSLTIRPQGLHGSSLPGASRHDTLGILKCRLLQVSSARVFDDFGGAAMGHWGRRFTYVTVYATILAEPIIFHLTSMEALQQIFYGSGITPIFAALTVAVVMVPMSQVHWNQ